MPAAEGNEGMPEFFSKFSHSNLNTKSLLL